MFSLFKRNTKQVELDGVRFEINYNYDDKDGSGPSATIDLLSLPTVANALSIISDDIAQVPLYHYIRTDNGRQRQRGELGYRLYQQPNDNQNGYEFWRTVTVQSLMGSAFVLMRGGQFHILPFGQTFRYQTFGGATRYAVAYSPEEAKALGLDPKKVHIKPGEDYGYREVLHFFSSQDEAGEVLPLRSRFKKVFGLGCDIYRYTCNIYNRGGVLAGYLTFDGPLDKTKKQDAAKLFKKMFYSSRADSENSSDVKLGVLDAGWKFQTLNLSPQEMMLLENKGDFTRDVAKIFKLPLWKLGVLSDYKYASAEQAQRDYLQGTLSPLLSQIQRECNSKLFDEVERDYFYVEHNPEKLISLDAKTQADVDHIYLSDGVYAKNEVREGLNMEKVAGGDFIATPVNMQSAAYTEQSEALKLEKAKLENEKLAVDIAASAAKAAAEVSKPAEPTQGEQPATAAPVQLNGAQITAAVDVLSRTATGALVPFVATELLVALGLPRETAEKMAAARPEPEAVAAAEGQPVVAAPEASGTDAGTRSEPEATDSPAPKEQAAEKRAEGEGQALLSRTSSAALAELQAAYATKLAGGMELRSLVSEAVAEVAGLHGLNPERLAKFAAAYAESAAKRVEGATTVNHAYEANRVLNAANFEAIRLLRGINARVRWVGGTFNGQVRSVDEFWVGSCKHPPLKQDECDCYLELE